MLNKCFFFLSLILFYSQSSLHAAAGGTPLALSVPGERLHEDLCRYLGVLADRTVAKIPSRIFFEKIKDGEESNNFSNVVAYLQDGRGNPDSPYVLAVLPLPTPLGKRRADMDETSVHWEMSPVSAAVHNSRFCYIGAACAIAQEFPDMVDGKALESYFSLAFQSESEGLYEADRAFLDIFIRI